MPDSDHGHGGGVDTEGRDEMEGGMIPHSTAHPVEGDGWDEDGEGRATRARWARSSGSNDPRDVWTGAAEKEREDNGMPSVQEGGKQAGKDVGRTSFQTACTRVQRLTLQRVAQNNKEASEWIYFYNLLNALA